MPYFKKSEAQNGRYSSDSKNHGQDGPLPVSDSIFVSPLAELYGKMAKTFGFLTQDINGDNQTGFDIPQVKKYKNYTYFYSIINYNLDRYFFDFTFSGPIVFLILGCLLGQFGS